MGSSNIQNNALWNSRIFWGVFVLKLGIGFWWASDYLSNLFAPFVSHFVLTGFNNSWDFFYSQGEYKVFPYPTIMLWVMALPRWLFSPLLSQDYTQVTALTLGVTRLPLLAFDVFLYWQLACLFPKEIKKIQLIYWCSPIVFYISYVHGQLDIIPTAIAFAAIGLLIRKNYLLSACVLALAALTKSHIFIVLPFASIYLYKQKISLQQACLMALAFTGTYSVFLLPYIGSESFRFMVFHSPEQDKLFEFAIPLSNQIKLYICPLALSLIFLKFASYKNLNKEILFMFLGIVFIALVVFVPPMPGWYLWSLPFVIYFYMGSEQHSRAPFILYNVVSVLYVALFFDFKPAFLQAIPQSIPLDGLSLSIVTASVSYIGIWMYRIGIEKNEELKISESPLLVGIGGDSASGKHTLLRTLENLVGQESAIAIFGDDFHKWSRGDEHWNVYTHLNPSANELHQKLDAAIALKDGRPIEIGHYDHITGTFQNPSKVEPNQFVFFVGLHPFYLQEMREKIQVKIFLDTEEALRQSWKVKRDVRERGATQDQVMTQIALREEDKESYISPQKEFADLVIRHEALSPKLIQSTWENSSNLKTTFTLNNSIETGNLLNQLSKIKSLNIQYKTNIHHQYIEAQGYVTSSQISHVAQALDLNLNDLSIQDSHWESNQSGLTQLLFCLVYAHQMRI